MTAWSDTSLRAASIAAIHACSDHSLDEAAEIFDGWIRQHDGDIRRLGIIKEEDH